MNTNEINKINDIFINNLPDNLKDVNNPIVIDLVLDGGMFNGSYLLGALYFFKDMEKRNYLKISRISGCSIGSLLGFLYLTDNLDLANSLYDIFSQYFKEKYNFEIYKKLYLYLQDKIPLDVCEKVNKKLFINYYNIKKCNKKIKFKFKNETEIIDTIIRSSFFPYIIDGNLTYKEKYFDGFNPYIFKKRSNRKIIFLDLSSIDKLHYALNIKNEKNNFHRILSGLVDVNTFYIKQTETTMCSYVNDWSYFNKIRFFIRQILEKIVYYIIYFLFFTQKYTDNNKYTKHIIYTLASKILYENFIIIIQKYCI
jgi:hypothetical protein